MFRFFGSIRNELFGKGQVTRYLGYAMSEIFLVVIGILLALEVNNWNEDRKNASYEIRMLSELHKALTSDIVYIEQHLIGDRIRVVNEAVSYFKRILKGEAVDQDSFRHHFVRITWGLTFQVNEGPYEALKSNGLDKISSDSLRNKLMYIYDFAIPRSEELVEWNIERGLNEAVKLKESMSNEFGIRLEENELSIFRKVPDVQIIHENSFLKLVYEMESVADWNTNRFSDLLKQLKELKVLLELHLNIS